MVSYVRSVYGKDKKVKTVWDNSGLFLIYVILTSIGWKVSSHPFLKVQNQNIFYIN